MIYFIVLGLLLTLFLKRNPLLLLDQVQFRYPYIILVALFLQIVMFAVFELNPVQYAYLLELTMLILVIGLWFNRHLPGVVCIMAGAIVNMISVLIHGGRMPVMERAAELAQIPFSPEDARHQLMTPDDIWWLGDWIPLFKVVISPGDVLVGIGIIWFLVKISPKRIKHVG